MPERVFADLQPMPLGRTSTGLCRGPLARSGSPDCGPQGTCRGGGGQVGGVWPGLIGAGPLGRRSFKGPKKYLKPGESDHWLRNMEKKWQNRNQ